MEYVIAVLVLSGFVLNFWLNRIIKRAVVQPIGADGKLMDARLSEKKRYAAILETYGILIGFIIGAVLVGLLWSGSRYSCVYFG